MHIGLFKRIGSYIIDMSPIFAVVFLLHSWFLGTMFQNMVSDDYASYETAYQEIVTERNEELQLIIDNYEAELITEDEYLEQYNELQDRFYDENVDTISVITQYWAYSFFYFLIAINAIYIAYMLIMKGQSLGRKVFKIQLYGNVKWHSIVLRELMWKNIIYTFPLVLGLALNPFLAMIIFIIFFAIDSGMIMFTKKKRTLRDIMSQTYLGYEGVDYPF